VLVFVVLVVALGWLISYIYNSPVILLIAILIALFQSLIGYYAGDQIILSTSGANQIQKKDNPMLYNVVENLCIASGLPTPKIYIIPDPMPNAFATGRDPKNASVAVTTGLLERLNKDELEGVIAHEMSHVGNYDIRLMMMVSILVSVIALVSDIFIRSQWLGLGRRRGNNDNSGGLLLIIGIVAAVLAPILAMLIQLAISRKREYLADADGALLTRYPDGLASALEKISEYNQPMQKVSTATAHLFIADPDGKSDDDDKPSFFARILSTHPPIKDRINILRHLNIK